MTLSAPIALLPGRTAVTVTAAWHSPARDLWVGSTADGRYIGMVERRGGEFVSTDWADRPVGRHSSLADGERALEALADITPLLDREGRLTRLTAAVAAGAAVAAVALASAVAVALPH